MNRRQGLAVLIAALFLPKAAAAADVDIVCPDDTPELLRLRRQVRWMRRRIRAKLRDDINEDFCGAPNELGEGWRWHAEEMLKWFDTGMPTEVR